MPSEIWNSPGLVRYVVGWAGSFTSKLKISGASGAMATNAGVRVLFVAALALVDTLSREFPELRGGVYTVQAGKLSEAMRADFRAYQREPRV